MAARGRFSQGELRGAPVRGEVAPAQHEQPWRGVAGRVDCVEHLIKKGWGIPRVAAWAGARAATSRRFLRRLRRLKAISVGAGIQTGPLLLQHDITPCTINIRKRPPLIRRLSEDLAHVVHCQADAPVDPHGENDRRVPMPMLTAASGLEDRGVKTEMVVYKGFGHGINKPRAMRAVMTHNLVWFNHYLWGDPLSDLANLPLPKKDEKDAKKDEKKEVGN